MPPSNTSMLLQSVQRQLRAAHWNRSPARSPCQFGGGPNHTACTRGQTCTPLAPAVPEPRSSGHPSWGSHCSPGGTAHRPNSGQPCTWKGMPAAVQQYGPPESSSWGDQGGPCGLEPHPRWAAPCSSSRAMQRSTQPRCMRPPSSAHTGLQRPPTATYALSSYVKLWQLVHLDQSREQSAARAREVAAGSGGSASIRRHRL